jgi:hypothetical protein
MQNFVGKIVYATPLKAHLAALVPYIVVEQTSFALTVVPARGGVHSIYTQTLPLTGPLSYEIEAWHDQPGAIEAVISDLTTMLNDDEFHMSARTIEYARSTLANLERLKLVRDAESFNDPTLGEPFDTSDWDDDFDPSEDEARAAGEAAATAKEEQRVADETLTSIFDRTPLVHEPTQRLQGCEGVDCGKRINIVQGKRILVICSPGELDETLEALLGGRL